MILAAIDIGSNAARLLITETSVYTNGTVDFTKLTLLRIPLRLGFDVFDKGFISGERGKKMLDTMKVYKQLMDIYNVEAYKACATSAMRDAANGKEILDQIKKEAGLTINIITGQEEANIVYETHIAEYLAVNKSYLYIDVGGGSTEVTLFSKDHTIFKESFNIGTIRLLHNKVTDEQWELLEPLLLRPAKPGRKHGDLRRVVDGVLYVTHTGCQWRDLPETFGPWTRVWSQLRRWRSNGVWASVVGALHEQVRLAADRDGRPSLVTVDSQLARGASQGGATSHDRAPG